MVVASYVCIHDTIIIQFVLENAMRTEHLSLNMPPSLIPG